MASSPAVAARRPLPPVGLRPLLSSFPAPPSYIPPSPAPTRSPISPSTDLLNNPPPTGPPSAPLPPVPETPSPVTEAEHLAFIGLRRISRGTVNHNEDRPSSPDIAFLIQRATPPRPRSYHSNAASHLKLKRFRSTPAFGLRNDEQGQQQPQLPTPDCDPDEPDAWDEDVSASDDDVIDLHTPLPHLMLRDGLLSPHSKLLPRPSPSPQTESHREPPRIQKPSSVPRDTRDTVKRRARHKDGRLLRGGIGLTTGLGWSDSEDEDAPSALTNRVSKMLSRKSSMASTASTSRKSSITSFSTVSRSGSIASISTAVSHPTSHSASRSGSVVSLSTPLSRPASRSSPTSATSTLPGATAAVSRPGSTASTAATARSTTTPVSRPGSGSTLSRSGSASSAGLLYLEGRRVSTPSPASRTSSGSGSSLTGDTDVLPRPSPITTAQSQSQHHPQTRAPVNTPINTSLVSALPTPLTPTLRRTPNFTLPSRTHLPAPTRPPSEALPPIPTPITPHPTPTPLHLRTPRTPRARTTSTSAAAPPLPRPRTRTGSTDVFPPPTARMEIGIAI